MAVTLLIGITQNSQSTSANTSNVTVTVSAKWTYGSYNLLDKSGTLKIDGTTYSFTSPFNTNQTTSGTCVLFTKTVNVSHNSDGTKKLSCSATYVTGVSSGEISASVSKTLTTIARKSTLSVVNGTLGTAQTLTVTRKSSSFTHTITATCGSASTTICTKSSSTSISFTPPISWASQNTTGTSVSVTYKITTYNGSTSLGSNSYTKTCSIPSSVKPSCSLTVTDAMGYADTYGAYIKSHSKFSVVVTPTTSYGSAIASYKATANGTTYSKPEFTTGVLNSHGTLTISATVTDERGRTGTASVNVTVLDYSSPRITKLTVHRCDEDGTANDKGEFVKVVFSATVTETNTNVDEAFYVLEYKKTTEDEYTIVTLDDYDDCFVLEDCTYIFPADSGSSYNVRVTVSDYFGSGAKATTASTGFTIMHWLASGLGMAIGKIAELTNVLDIGFQTRFSGGILHPVLEPETDLNDVLTPNTYVGANISYYNYANCPLTSGTFTLEVVGMGEDGQVKQRLTYCHKTEARALERIYYGEAWGDWVCVSDFDGQLLWSGGYYMSASQTISLAEAVSMQRSGIVLVFSRYSDSTARNYHFNSFFVHKYMVKNHEGQGHTFAMYTGDPFEVAASKYLYISDTSITGNDVNIATGTGASGITYDNSGFVLRYVIGV